MGGVRICQTLPDSAKLALQSMLKTLPKYLEKRTLFLKIVGLNQEPKINPIFKPHFFCLIFASLSVIETLILTICLMDTENMENAK